MVLLAQSQEMESYRPLVVFCHRGLVSNRVGIGLDPAQMIDPEVRGGANV